MIFNIIQIIILIYFSIATLYIFIFAVAGLFKLKKIVQHDDKKRKFVLLIPAFKEDKVIIETVKTALKSDYPNELLDIYVLADSFKKETLIELEKFPIEVIELSFEQSTKAKSINKALEIIPDDYEYVMILDSDNLMEKDFVSKINIALSSGYKIIQGHRVAKNTNTPLAILDAISEELANHLYRKGHSVLGLSAALIGSGFAVDFQTYKKFMKNLDSYGGEDKLLDLELRKGFVKIRYIDDAYIYDEKVQKFCDFIPQRSRWFANQYIYGKAHIFQGFSHLIKKGNIDYFNYAFIQTQPPRIFLIGFLFFISVLSIIFNPISFTIAWLSVFLLCVIAFLFSIPKRFYNRKLIKAVLYLPVGFFWMMAAMFNMKGYTKRPTSTSHTITDFDIK